jgi:hypothetical protein
MVSQQPLSRVRKEVYLRGAGLILGLVGVEGTPGSLGSLKCSFNFSGPTGSQNLSLLRGAPDPGQWLPSLPGLQQASPTLEPYTLVDGTFWSGPIWSSCQVGR